MNVSSIATFSMFPRASIIWSLQYTAAAANISFGLFSCQPNQSQHKTKVTTSVALGFCPDLIIGLTGKEMWQYKEWSVSLGILHFPDRTKIEHNTEHDRIHNTQSYHNKLYHRV